MEKQEYVCTIDGEQFGSKEELFAHIEKEYMKIVDVKKDLQEEKAALEKAFPGFSIVVKEQEDDLIVRMEMDGVKGEIKFEITQKDPRNRSRQYPFFSNLEEATAFFGSFFQKIDFVLSATYLKMQKYRPNIKEVKLVSFHCGEEYPDDWYNVSPIVVLEDEEIQIRKFGMNDYEIEESTNETFYENLQVYLRNIDADFITEIEGVVSQNYDRDNYYVERWYEVDGINLNILAERAKRLYVKIIEEK